MIATETTTEYDLMFATKAVKCLLASTRVILLRYYAEADIVAVVNDLEKKGVPPETLGFQRAIDEFEHRGTPRLAPFASWIRVSKNDYG